MFIPWRNTKERYGAVAQLLHWTIVVLVICQFVLGFSASGMPISIERLVILVRHKSIGMTILALALISMPIVGWITSSASHLTVTWFGLFPFPNLVGPDAGLAKLAKATHAAMAWTLLGVASLHAAAALWHHFKLKDSVLLRMLPLPIAHHEDKS